MANEKFKTINTRIALRTGDFAYWTTGAGKDIELIKGEVCVCTVAATDNQATTAPTVLFKVCDTTGKKFADLKWTSALAADVYAWAKATEAEHKEWLKTNHADLDTRYNFAVEGDKLVVTKDLFVNGEKSGDTLEVGKYEFLSEEEVRGILADYYTKEEVNGLISGVIGDKDKDTKDSNTIIGAKKYTDAVVEGIVSGSGYATQTWVTGEIEKLDKADTAVAGQYVSAVSEENGIITVTRANLPTSGVLTVVKGDDTITIGGTDQNPTIAVTANKFDAYGAAAAVLGESTDGASANTVYGAKAAAAAAQNDATIAKTKIETFLGTVTPDGSQDIIDTLAEINSYVGAHGEEFATLSGKVTNIENGTVSVPKAVDADTLDGHDSLYFATAESVKNISDNLGALAGKDKIAEGDIEGTIAVGKISGLGALATKDNITHDLVSDFDAEVAKIKVTNAGDADTLGTHAPEYFATAERVKALEDAKHINKVEADTGLKVVKGSTNEDNKVAIDTDVVFILDCNW